MNIKGKDFISLLDFDKATLMYLIDLAQKLKHENQEGHIHSFLENKTLAMIFAKPSLRTRVSFEVGIKQLGGHSVVLKQEEISLGSRETIADTARVLSRYVDGIMIRTFSHNDVIEMAKYANVPVINALTDLAHPCQVLADLLTIKERFKTLDNLKLAYMGDGNNMANSLMAGCAILGINISIACPKHYPPDQEYLEKSLAMAQKSGAKIFITPDPVQAARNARIVYTDVWASMGHESESEERKLAFRPYQVNQHLLSHASPDAIVLHCLPAHREEEITDEIFEKHANVIFTQAENRLHAQKAIMASIM